MRIFFLGLLFFGIQFGAVAQLQFNATSRHDLNRIQRIWSEQKEKSFESLANEFPVYSLQGKIVISLLGKVNDAFHSSLLTAEGITIGSRIGDVITLKVPLDKLDVLFAAPGISYLEIASKVQQHLNRALTDARVDSVHLGIDLPQAYTGKDVLIGITDWGFDYTHPMFYDTALQQTRILAAWDQYKQAGPAPEGFTYGTEYATIPDLLSAGSDTANIYSYAYHGSHVAGIAGGAGAGTIYKGVAFESQFLFTTFLVDAASVIDAYQWMYEKSVAENKRLVINQSWGLYYIGNLDGTSLISQAIDQYSELGVVFASSGGNNGDVNFHLKKTFDNDTLRSKIDFYSYTANPKMWGQSITMWGEQGKSFAARVKVLNSINQFQAQTAFFPTTTVPYIDTFLIIGVDTVFYNLSAEASNPLNSRPHIRLRVKNKSTAYKVLLEVAAVDGTVHAWNVTELTSGVGNWGMPFSQAGAGTLIGDANYSIGEPSCTESVISVAAHSSTYALPNGNLTGGAIANFSSKGPTLDGRTKPDISAPGVNVGSSVSSFTDNSFSTVLTINFQGQDYKFTRISGTSMSSPMVAGVAALILDANPYLMPYQIKSIIQQTARMDSYTGLIPAAGDLQWGYGKVHAYEAVKLALNTVSLPENESKWTLNVYPNPSTGLILVEGNLIGNEKYTLHSSDGKIISSGKISSNQLDFTNLSTGFYILKISGDNGAFVVRILIE